MADSILTKSDYQNLLLFSQDVLSLNSKFLDGVLQMIKKYFGWNLSLYYVLDKMDITTKPVLRIIESQGLDQHFLDKCKNVYDNDTILYDIIQNHRISNTWSGIFYTHNMMTQEEYSKTDYFSLLSEYDIYYTAVMSVSTMPEIRINLFKTRKEGPFTKQEMKQLNEIRKILMQISKHHIYRCDTENTLHAIDQIFDEQNIGRLIIDSSLIFFDYNEHFFRMVSKFCTNKSINEILKEFISIIENNQNTRLTAIYEKISFPYKEYDITVYPNANISSDVIRWQYYLCIVQPQNNYTQQKKVINKYNLTSRECQVLSLLSEGCANKEISARLSISTHTVKAHVSSLFMKLNVDSRSSTIALINKEPTLKFYIERQNS